MIKRLAVSGLFMVLASACTASDKSSGQIIHDGEFDYLKAQHGEEWAKQDKDIDAKLAEIRKKNGGKRPNILYILVDDVGFSDFGIPEMNYVRGTKTPNINKLADQGVSFMRM
jgi:arylsulfatase A-like enzyme